MQISSSDQKVTKIRAALTPVVDLLHYRLKRPVRILTITGLRAEESKDRRELPVYSVRESLENRHEDVWLAVHRVTTDQIRALVDDTPVGHHWAYDSRPGAGDWQGSSRVSCSECVLGNKRDLILATRRRPRLAALYLEVEEHIGHRFRFDMSMKQIIGWAEGPGGPEPGVVLQEDGPEFLALERDVRRRLAEGSRLPAGTEFTAVPQAVCLACVGC
ncbi:hypothetical protein [Saccharothrix sp.]|uniref:hypothetical protein n=1 Tax=Saccharothrix sp. TaxID=1873460 RepID=UPI0028115214|nr:hypothetical protein [Saccharothrix sp.]